MKKLVPLGEYVLLKKVKIEEKKDGGLMVASTEDPRYEVMGYGDDVVLQIDGLVFVQQIDLIPVMLNEKEKYFLTKEENIIAMEGKDEG